MTGHLMHRVMKNGVQSQKTGKDSQFRRVPISCFELQAYIDLLEVTVSTIAWVAVALWPSSVLPSTRMLLLAQWSFCLFVVLLCPGNIWGHIRMGSDLWHLSCSWLCPFTDSPLTDNPLTDNPLTDSPATHSTLTHSPLTTVHSPTVHSSTVHSPT